MHCESHTHHDIVYELQRASAFFILMNVNLQGLDFFPTCPRYYDLVIFSTPKYSVA